ncbi:unnamed protein product [Cercopithifilaria johnstoni]|uniref:Uncharacterized protein n=1 Tax=Cercopithifilaria johnstoni TaxID=2874296 RepID=A0A8J2LYY2_9BILA|nr:unnamed protein product [Cercopithifilaria johnstoni]
MKCFLLFLICYLVIHHTFSFMTIKKEPHDRSRCYIYLKIKPQYQHNNEKEQESASIFSLVTTITTILQGGTIFNCFRYYKKFKCISTVDDILINLYSNLLSEMHEEAILSLSTILSEYL